MADDAALLLENLGLESANVFGISMGGRIARELPLEYPRRVRRVILASTGCGVHGLPPAADIAQVMLQVASGGDLEALRQFVRVCVSEPFARTETDLLDERAHGECE